MNRQMAGYGRAQIQAFALVRKVVSNHCLPMVSQLRDAGNIGAESLELAGLLANFQLGPSRRRDNEFGTYRLPWKQFRA
jgi:hypothetical protein